MRVRSYPLEDSEDPLDPTSKAFLSSLSTSRPIERDPHASISAALRRKYAAPQKESQAGNDLFMPRAPSPEKERSAIPFWHSSKAGDTGVFARIDSLSHNLNAHSNKSKEDDDFDDLMKQLGE